MQERVVGGGDRVMGDGSQMLLSKCSTWWGGHLVMYGGDVRWFSGGSGCTGHVHLLEMSSKEESLVTGCSTDGQTALQASQSCLQLAHTVVASRF